MLDRPNSSNRDGIESARRKSEERLRSIVESAVDGIIAIDAKGIVQDFNPAAERLFGYRAYEVSRTGLGLAIAKRVVESHGGSIRITARPGSGTTVSGVLPAGR